MPGIWDWIQELAKRNLYTGVPGGTPPTAYRAEQAGRVAPEFAAPGGRVAPEFAGVAPSPVTAPTAPLAPLGIPPVAQAAAPLPAQAPPGGWLGNLPQHQRGAVAAGGQGGGTEDYVPPQQGPFGLQIDPKKDVPLGKKIMGAFGKFLNVAMGEGAEDMPADVKTKMVLMSLLTGVNTAVQHNRQGFSTGPGMLPALMGGTAQWAEGQKEDDRERAILAEINDPNTSDVRRQ